MKRKLAGVAEHDEREVEELRADRELAVEYLRAAIESLDQPEDRAASLLALRAVAQAYGGLGAVAAAAGLSRESLYRALSPKGNPTLKTLVAVLKTVGLKLSVAREQRSTSPARRLAPRSSRLTSARVGRRPNLRARVTGA